MQTATEIAPKKHHKTKKRLAKVGKGAGIVGGLTWGATSVGEFILNVKRDKQAEAEEIRYRGMEANLLDTPANSTERESMLQTQARKEALKKEVATQAVGAVVIASVISTVAYAGWAGWGWYKRRQMKQELANLESKLSKLETEDCQPGTDDYVIRTRDIAKTKVDINTLKTNLMK